MLDDRWYWIGLALVIGWVLWLLAPILTPFVLAAAFAYLGDPIADRLEQWRFTRTWAVVAVFVLLTLIFIFVAIVLLPLLGRQIGRLIAGLPTAVEWFRTSIVPWLSANFGVAAESFDLGNITAVVKQNWRDAGGLQRRR